MRIALVTDWFLPRVGGVEAQVGDLFHALKAAGHAPRVITTTPGGDMEGLDVTRLGGPRLPWFDLSLSPGLPARLRAEFISGEFDVVHAHASSLFSPVGFSAARVAAALGLPAVITFHSVLDEYLRILRAADRALGWSRAPVLFTAVSGLVARQVSETGGGVEVSVLPNGFDRARWTVDAPRAPPGARPIIAFATLRLNARKRPLHLVEAFARAHEKARAGGRRLELRIAGDGPKRSRIEAAIDRFGVRDAVKLLGAFPRDELRAHYAQADFFVLPSIRESFGIAALEARCAGLPVIAMRAAGCGEFLRDGETGLLAADDNMLADHIARLALDDDLRARLAPPDEGLARFEWPRIVAAHLEAYGRAKEIARAAQPGG